VVTWLLTLSDWADRLVRLLAVPIGTATILLVFFEVLLRYVFRAPLVTSVEVARIGFVWSCFLGATLGVKREKHIRFVFLLERCAPAGEAILRASVSLLSVAFFLLMTLKGIEMVQRVWDTYFPALGYSQLWLYLPLPMSAACMLVHTLAFLARDLSRLRAGGPRGSLP